MREKQSHQTYAQTGVHICSPTNTMREHSVVEDKPGVKFTVCLSSCFLKRFCHGFQGRSVIRPAVIQGTIPSLTDVPVNCLP